MNISSARFAVPFLALSLLGAGCFSSSNSGPTGPDGGIWKTTNGGQVWTNKKVLNAGTKLSAAVASYAITTMVFDPQDRQTIYAGTRANGLIYTIDGGDSWQQPRTLTTGRVNAIAVDSKNKCLVYAASANKLFKTETCGRDWTQIFFDPRTSKSFTKLVVDWYNPTVLYAGTDDGDIYRSRDSGANWQLSKRVDGTPITDIIVDNKDSRVVYVGTQGEGIFKSTDGAETWLQIKKQFTNDFPDARRVISLVMDPQDNNVLYEVSKFGIIKTTDGGDTWKALNLTTPPGSIAIYTLAIDPKNTKNLVFAGNKTLQFSTDGGLSWAPKKLPTTQVGYLLLIDPTNSETMYLGTVPPAK